MRRAGNSRLGAPASCRLICFGFGYWVHPGFFLFTAFVGANLFQSAFTNACPMMALLRKLGFEVRRVGGRRCMDEDEDR